MGNGCSHDDDHYPCTVCVGKSVHDENGECYRIKQKRLAKIKVERDLLLAFENALSAYQKSTSFEQHQGKFMQAMVATYIKWIGEYDC